MRKHFCLIALSLLAAAFAGCSSADKDPTVRLERHEVTNAPTKHASVRVQHANACGPSALLIQPSA